MGILKNYSLPTLILCGLCYEIHTADVYKYIDKDKDKYFDSSNYPPGHDLYSAENKKKLGTYTDETKEVPIVDFVGLKPKLYAFVCEDEYEKITAKGVVAATSRTKLKFQIFLDCLEKYQTFYFKNTSIRSFNHDVVTIDVNKLCISPFDNKRWILPNTYDTLALGHYLTLQ